VHLDQGSATLRRVFLACHSDQALALLESIRRPPNSEVLSAIPYQANEAVLHTDTALLPKRRLAWAAWNYLMPDGPGGRVCLTYDMNILQAWMPGNAVRHAQRRRAHRSAYKVIARHDLSPSAVHPCRHRAQARHREIDGTLRTYYCGAWWGNGFHEDGVVSALDALRHFREDQLFITVPRCGRQYERCTARSTPAGFGIAVQRPAACFRYRLFMLWLDLDELEQVFAKRWLWSTTGPNLAWWRRADHFGDPARPLADAVRDEVANGKPAGVPPVRFVC
jgi:hypothetical protein